MLKENTGSVFSESHPALPVHDWDFRILLCKQNRKELVYAMLSGSRCKDPQVANLSVLLEVRAQVTKVVLRPATYLVLISLLPTF